MIGFNPRPEPFIRPKPRKSEILQESEHLSNPEKTTEVIISDAELNEMMRGLEPGEFLDVVDRNRRRVLEEEGVWPAVTHALGKVFEEAEWITGQKNWMWAKTSGEFVGFMSSIKATIGKMTPEKALDKIGQFWERYLDKERGRELTFTIGGDAPYFPEDKREGRRVGGIEIQENEHEFADQLEAAMGRDYALLEILKEEGLLNEDNGNMLFSLPNRVGGRFAGIINEETGELIPEHEFRKIYANTYLEWKREPVGPEAHLNKEIEHKAHEDITQRGVTGDLGPEYLPIFGRQREEAERAEGLKYGPARTAAKEIGIIAGMSAVIIIFDPEGENYNEVNDYALGSMEHVVTISHLKSRSGKDNHLRHEISPSHDKINGRGALQKWFQQVQLEGIHNVELEAEVQPQDYPLTWWDIDVGLNPQNLKLLGEKYGLYDQDGNLTPKGDYVADGNKLGRSWLIGESGIEIETLSSTDRVELTKKIQTAGRELLTKERKESAIKSGLAKLLKQDRDLQEKFAEKGIGFGEDELEELTDRAYEHFTDNMFFVTEATLNMMVFEAALRETDWVQVGITAHDEPSRELSPLLASGKRGKEGIFPPGGGFSAREAARFLMGVREEVANGKNGGFAGLVVLEGLVGKKGWVSGLGKVGGGALRGAVKLANEYSHMERNAYLSILGAPDAGSSIDFSTAKQYPLAVGAVIEGGRTHLAVDVNLEKRLMIEQSLKFVVEAVKGKKGLGMDVLLDPRRLSSLSERDFQTMYATLVGEVQEALAEGEVNISAEDLRGLNYDVGKAITPFVMEEHRELVREAQKRELSQEETDKLTNYVSKTLAKNKSYREGELGRLFQPKYRDKAEAFLIRLVSRLDQRKLIWFLRNNRPIMDNILTNTKVLEFLERKFTGMVTDGMEYGVREIKESLEEKK